MKKSFLMGSTFFFIILCMRFLVVMVHRYAFLWFGVWTNLSHHWRPPRAEFLSKEGTGGNIIKKIFLYTFIFEFLNWTIRTTDSTGASSSIVSFTPQTSPFHSNHFLVHLTVNFSVCPMDIERKLKIFQWFLFFFFLIYLFDI